MRENVKLLTHTHTLSPSVQVRVFVHSATGQVIEKDLTYMDHEPFGEEEEEGVGAHNKTANKSVAMDLTCVDSVSSEPTLTSTSNGQVWTQLYCGCGCVGGYGCVWVCV